MKLRHEGGEIGDNQDNSVNALDVSVKPRHEGGEIGADAEQLTFGSAVSVKPRHEGGEIADKEVVDGDADWSQ